MASVKVRRRPDGQARRGAHRQGTAMGREVAGGGGRGEGICLLSIPAQALCPRSRHGGKTRPVSGCKPSCPVRNSPLFLCCL